MKAKILTSLLLLSLIAPIARCSEEGDSEDGNRCKKEIVESYNLNGYLTPRPLSLFICPGIRQSCCSLYDQFMMMTNWRDKIKPRLNTYYESYAAKMLKIKDLLTDLMELNIPKMIERLPIDDKQKEKHISTFLRLKTIDTDSLIDEIIVMQKDSAKYLMGLRASFYCTICDFGAHHYLNLKEKIFSVDMNTCSDIAKNTINFSHYMTVNLAGHLHSISEMMSIFAETESDKPIKIRNYPKITKQIKACSKQIAKQSGKLTACKRYCEHWKINSNAPVLEGYHGFLNSMIAALGKFLTAHANEPRILAENNPALNLDNGVQGERSVVNETQTKKGFVLSEEDESMERIMKERLLSDEGEWFFDPTKAVGVKDPYDETIVDPNFDEFMLNQMFNIQDDYDQERKIGNARFIASKIGQIDVEPDTENGTEDDIFKTNSGVIVDLENFQTSVNNIGFDITAHSQNNNMNSSMRELVTNMKRKSRYPILYEKIDPKLLFMVNGIGNEDVTDFHRDNFINFQDFSVQLKKTELEAKLKVNE